MLLTTPQRVRRPSFVIAPPPPEEGNDWFSPVLTFQAGVPASVDLAGYAGHLTGGTVKIGMLAGYHPDMSISGTVLNWSGASGLPLDAGDRYWFSAWIDNGIRNFHNPRTGDSYTTWDEMQAVLVEGLDTEVWIEPKLYTGNQRIHLAGTGWIVGPSWNIGKNYPFKFRSAVPGTRARLHSLTYLGGIVTWSDLTNGNISFEDLEFATFTRHEISNEACIRSAFGDGATINIRRCYFHNTPNGLLGGGAGVKWFIYDSLFAHNGNVGAAGQTHNMYIGGDEVYLEGCWSRAAYQGHLVKSVAKKTTVKACRLISERTQFDEGEEEAYNFDAMDGGDILLEGNIIVQEGSTGNRGIISVGASQLAPDRTHRVRMYQNTIVHLPTDLSGTFITINAGLTDRDIKDNVFAGIATDQSDYSANNTTVVLGDFGDTAARDYSLSTPISGTQNWVDKEYVHPFQTENRSDANRGALSDTTWTPPYSLPDAGETLEIGENYWSDLRPDGWTPANWQEPAYIGFGGGNFMEEYSEAGAYGLAGSGGHGEATLFGAQVFDFTTARFEHIQPQGGVTHYRTNDYEYSEMDGTGLWQNTSTPPGDVCFEITGTSGLPACPHPYNDQVYLPPSMGGGPKGSLVYAHRAALGRTGSQTSPMAHRFQLAEPGQLGQWTRFSSNVHTRAPYSDIQTSSVLDRPNNRIWWIDGNSVTKLMYLDLADGLFKDSETMTGATPAELFSTGWCFYFKGLIIKQVVDLTTDLLALWAIDTTNIAAGWQKLTLVNPHPSIGIGNPFVYVPTTGKLYQMPWEGDNGPAGSGLPAAPYTNSLLRRITPPNSDDKSVLLAGNWTCDTTPIDPPVPVPAPAGYSQARFMYVPKIDRLAWIPGLSPGPQNWGWPVETRVYLIGPQ